MKGATCRQAEKITDLSYHQGTLSAIADKRN